jgi:glutathione S-transferase
MKRKVAQNMGECFALIEARMFEGPYVMGATYTIADAYLFTLAQWLEGDGVDLAHLPKIADHRQRVTDRPAVQKVLAAELDA